MPFFPCGFSKRNTSWRFCGIIRNEIGWPSVLTPSRDRGGNSSIIPGNLVPQGNTHLRLVRLLTDDLIRGGGESFCRYEISSVQRSWTGEIPGTRPGIRSRSPDCSCLHVGPTAGDGHSGSPAAGGFHPGAGAPARKLLNDRCKSAETVFRQACGITASCPEFEKLQKVQL